MTASAKKVITINFEIYIHKIIHVFGGNLNNFLY